MRTTIRYQTVRDGELIVTRNVSVDGRNGDEPLMQKK